MSARFQLREHLADADIDAVGGFYMVVFVIRPEIDSKIVGDTVEIRDGCVSAVLGRTEALLLYELAYVLCGLWKAAFGQRVGKNMI